MSNRFNIEYFGDSIGTPNNITRMFAKGQIGLMLTIKSENNLSKAEYIISREEAEKLRNQIDFLISSITETTGSAISLEVV